MSRKIYICNDMALDDRLADIAETDQEAALVWPWFLTAFDDWGRAEASPRRIKAQVFPTFPITQQRITEIIDLYCRMRLIRRYEVDGKVYLYIPTNKWYLYQTHIRNNKREDDKSRYPAPPRDEDMSINPVVASDAQMRANARDDAQCCATLSPSLSLSLSPSLSPSSEVAAAPLVAASSTPDEARPQKVFDETTEAYRLALRLRSKICERRPGTKLPPITPKGLAKWAKHTDLMIRIDGRPPGDIERIIDFAQADPFWQSNILSTEKLREKYDQLADKAQKLQQAPTLVKKPEEMTYDDLQRARDARAAADAALAAERQARLAHINEKYPISFKGGA